MNAAMVDGLQVAYIAITALTVILSLTGLWVATHKEQFVKPAVNTKKPSL